MSRKLVNIGMVPKLTVYMPNAFIRGSWTGTLAEKKLFSLTLGIYEALLENAIPVDLVEYIAGCPAREAAEGLNNLTVYTEGRAVKIFRSLDFEGQVMKFVFTEDAAQYIDPFSDLMEKP